jgi:hypothetical protein
MPFSQYELLFCGLCSLASSSLQLKSPPSYSSPRNIPVSNPAFRHVLPGYVTCGRATNLPYNLRTWMSGILYQCVYSLTWLGSNTQKPSLLPSSVLRNASGSSGKACTARMTLPGSCAPASIIPSFLGTCSQLLSIFVMTLYLMQLTKGPGSQVLYPLSPACGHYWRRLVLPECRWVPAYPE